MNLDEILVRVFSDQWRVLLICSALFSVAAELGYRRGLFLYRSEEKSHKDHTSGLQNSILGIQGSILGLLGLFMAFTFAMAVARYEARRDVVVQEANAIGTTWLRTSLLPEPQGEASRELLRKYVENRLTFYQVWNDKDRTASVTNEASILQKDLWAQAVAASKAAPTPMTATYVITLNETIDLEASRLALMHNYVPGVVWILLLILAMCGSASCGISSGSSGLRSLFANVVIPLLLALVITIIADINRPRLGMIGLSQASMQNLKKSIDATPRR